MIISRNVEERVSFETRSLDESGSFFVDSIYRIVKERGSFVD